MNQLTYYIWLSDALPGLAAGISLICALSLFAFGLWVAGWFIAICSTVGERKNPDDYEKKERWSIAEARDMFKPWQPRITVLSALVAILVLTNAVPSRSTMRLMIVSQIGEKVIQTPDSREIYGALKAKLLDLLQDKK